MVDIIHLSLWIIPIAFLCLCIIVVALVAQDQVRRETRDHRKLRQLHRTMEKQVKNTKRGQDSELISLTLPIPRGDHNSLAEKLEHWNQLVYSFRNQILHLPAQTLEDTFLFHAIFPQEKCENVSPHVKELQDILERSKREFDLEDQYNSEGQDDTDSYMEIAKD